MVIQPFWNLTLMRPLINCYRYKRADRGRLDKLLRLCTHLDPRLVTVDDATKEELVVQAIALGKYLSGFLGKCIMPSNN